MFALFGKTAEEGQEEAQPQPMDHSPHQVILALKILTLFEYRPAKMVKSLAKGTESGVDFSASSQWDREVTKKPVELTREQKALQATACLVLNSYLSDYLVQMTEPIEDV